MITNEIKSFLEEEAVPQQTDVFANWKINQNRFPNIYKLAKNYLNIYATQVSSERLFSLGGDVVEEKPARLLDENVKAICLLHSNLNNNKKKYLA